MPGDRQKFKFPEVWAGRMKRKMQLMQLKQINAAPARKGARTAIQFLFPPILLVDFSNSVLLTRKGRCLSYLNPIYYSHPCSLGYTIKGLVKNRLIFISETGASIPFVVCR